MRSWVIHMNKRPLLLFVLLLLPIISIAIQQMPIAHALVPSNCYWPATTGDLQLNDAGAVGWDSAGYQLLSTGQLACPAERSAVSDGVNFNGVVIEDSVGNLRLSYSWHAAYGYLAGSASIVAINAGAWNFTSPYWTVSNAIIHTGVSYFGIVTYNYSMAAVQWTSISVAYAGTPSIPTATIGSTYAVTITNDTSGFKGNLQAYLETDGHAWITQNSGADTYILGHIIFYRGTAADWTGASMAWYSYQNYAPTYGAYQINMYLAETSTALYGIIGPVNYGQDSGMSANLYKPLVSLTAQVSRNAPSQPISLGLWDQMGSPPQVWGSLRNNQLYIWYLSAHEVYNTPNRPRAFGTMLVTYAETPNYFIYDVFPNPTGVSNDLQAWKSAAVVGATNKQVATWATATMTPDISVLFILASNYQIYYYTAPTHLTGSQVFTLWTEYTSSGSTSSWKAATSTVVGASASPYGPFKVSSPATPTGNSYLSSAIAVTPFTNTAATYAGSYGYPAAANPACLGDLQLYVQDQQQSSAPQIWGIFGSGEPLVSVTIYTTSTTQAGSVTIAYDYTRNTYVDSLFALLLVMSGFVVLVIDRSISALLIAISIGLVLAVGTTLLPIYMLLLVVGLIAASLLTRSKG